MALTLHSPSSFLSSIDSAKPQKVANRDFPAFSISFRSIRLKGRVRAKFIAAKASPEVSPAVEERAEERLHRHCRTGSGSGGLGSCRRVPVYVMLPLDTVGICGGLNRARAMGASMMALKSAGVEGVMVDVWWGVVERAGPRRYDWETYAELVRMAERYGLKMQMVMSFHQCGGNVGDSCHIPLPGWVIEEVNRDPDIVYTDRSGRRNPEYISLGCDTLPVLRGRTPIQVYADYMQSFRDRFRDYLGNVIVEIQVGTGPCGELRYPSYPESSGAWKFPGIGEFQCYDKYMMASLRAAAVGIGREEWGRSGPHDAGNYRQHPEETGFFRQDGKWKTDYGRFFLEWYSGELLAHGDRVLAAAEGVFRGTGAKLSAKVAGVHWHYDSASHAAELAAGYYNAGGRDGYVPVARVLARRGAAMNFTCMEMRDGEQPPGCSPERLVRQVREASRAVKAELAGENALERYDDGAYAQVLETSRADERAGLVAFTYLRMSKSLFEGENWRRFVTFVKGMAEGGRRGAALPRCDSVHSDLCVGSVIAGREQEDEFAAAAF